MFSNCPSERRYIRIGCIFWLFFTVYFQMNLQITCHNWFGSICLTFIYVVYSNGLSPVCKSLWSFKTGVLVEYLSQFLQCLHWKGLHSANAPMCIFKSFSLEKVLALSSHAESPFPACSDHVNLQTLPTWEKFCTTSATVKTLSNFYRTQVSWSDLCVWFSETE